MAAAEVTEIKLPANEFEVDLGSLGRLRGRIDVKGIHEIERRTGSSFMALSRMAAEGLIGFADTATMVEVTLKKVLENATPTRDEIEAGVLEAGLGNVARALHRPIVYVMNGSDAGSDG